MLSYEKKFHQKGFQIVVGVDEAGRGPLAGPVVAAAVYLKSRCFSLRITDSKKMTPISRKKAACEIYQKSYVGLGVVGPGVIDRINILNATFRAMNQAIKSLLKQIFLTPLPQDSGQNKIMLLIDGNAFSSTLPYVYKTIIHGDARSLSIACASIIAKVQRDDFMERISDRYPLYGFHQNKGYPTLKHRQQIQKYGLSSAHRKSFSSRV